MPVHNSSSTLVQLRSRAHPRTSSLSGLLARSHEANALATSAGDPTTDHSSRFTEVIIEGKPLSPWTYHYPHDEYRAVEPITDSTPVPTTASESVPSIGNLQYLTMGSPGGGGQIIAVPWHDQVSGSEQPIEQDSLVVQGNVSVLQIHHRGREDVTVMERETKGGEIVTTILWHGGQVTFKGIVDRHYAQTIQHPVLPPFQPHDQNQHDGQGSEQQSVLQ